jgi:hypothetical protein
VTLRSESSAASNTSFTLCHCSGVTHVTIPAELGKKSLQTADLVLLAQVLCTTNRQLLVLFARFLIVEVNTTLFEGFNEPAEQAEA